MFELDDDTVQLQYGILYVVFFTVLAVLTQI